jgi:hypothetical protein
MQIHTLAAQHTFVNRMIFVAFYPEASVFFFVYHDATTYTAITAGGTERICIMIISDHSFFVTNSGPFSTSLRRTLVLLIFFHFQV